MAYSQGFHPKTVLDSMNELNVHPDTTEKAALSYSGEHPSQLWKERKSFLKQYVRESLVPAQDAVPGYSPRLTMFLLAAFPAHQIATEVSRISQK